MRTDAALIQIVDAAVAEAARLAGDALRCRAGCSHCCVGPFVVTEADLRRLRPHATSRIRERAEEAREAMRAGFPGDFARGLVTRNADAFEDNHHWLPCPVLDLETGACELHSHRPLACRLHGPALRVNGQDVKHCRLNYEGLTGAELERRRVELTIPEDAPENGLTYIAWAFTQTPGG